MRVLTLFPGSKLFFRGSERLFENSPRASSGQNRFLLSNPDAMVLRFRYSPHQELDIWCSVRQVGSYLLWLRSYRSQVAPLSLPLSDRCPHRLKSVLQPRFYSCHPSLPRRSSLLFFARFFPILVRGMKLSPLYIKNKIFCENIPTWPINRPG